MMFVCRLHGFVPFHNYLSSSRTKDDITPQEVTGGVKRGRERRCYIGKPNKGETFQKEACFL